LLDENELIGQAFGDRLVDSEDCAGNSTARGQSVKKHGATRRQEG
jgi:hypothetical protein